ncbi:hypothetical protein BT96DRAFT_918352 [Gymnopus androsaceus JB14]|uniref:Uncharacterized protein n=1 Tax=Gymnopus androsaceus JB14 TaxID=1447944 RepID=A0A6A4HZL0_9AGAR|nr:hypothetical protein BT96DRAFT_918352 [Gymnopus androsaceus JB14]
MIFSLIRYSAAIYGLALEYLYPFNSLPFAISISDELQESLKYQAQAVSLWSAIVSIAFLNLFVFFFAIFSLAHGMLALAMYYRPALREKVQKRMAEKALKRQNKKKPSRRAAWGSIMFNVFFSIAMIINDAIFNRSEDAASLKDGVIERFQYLLTSSSFIIRIQMQVFTFIFAFALLFSLLRTIIRRRRQQGVVADEESRLTSGEMAQVEEVQQSEFVVEEKLIDFSDGMNGLYEKMEAYAAPTPADAHATEREAEPLVRL